MKIEQLLSLGWVGKHELFEMSLPRKRAHELISALGGPIVEQFLKLTYLNSPHNYRHWLHGLNNYLLQIQEITLKPNNSRPGPGTYYKWLFDDMYTLIESNVIARFNYLHEVRYNNIPLKKQFNATETLNDVQHAFSPKTSKLLNDISAGRFRTTTDYHKFL